jgi:hypothetical protein
VVRVAREAVTLRESSELTFGKLFGPLVQPGVRSIGLVKTPTKPPLWGAYVGYSGAASGCISFQVDHDDTPAETFVYGY